MKRVGSERIGRATSSARVGIAGLLCAGLVNAAIWSGAIAAPTETARDTPAAAPQAEQRWLFEALLDGKPIGTHRVTVTGTEEQRHVRVDVAFDVKILSLTVYRYRHEARETWRGDCLQTLDAKSDDNGTVTQVRARREGDHTVVDAASGRQSLPACVSTYAYWNPSVLLDQHDLLNPQTGRYERVAIDRVGTQTQAEIPVNAEHFRIGGIEQPIDLWYSKQRDWLALATTAGGKALRYRLETP